MPRHHGRSGRRRARRGARGGRRPMSSQRYGKNVTPPTDPCPPGYIMCPNGTCVAPGESCTDFSPGTVETGPGGIGANPWTPGSGPGSPCPSNWFVCWDGSCVSSINNCPTNPNFSPGTGETSPGGFGAMPRVPASQGQCYCICSEINNPVNVDFNGFIGSCTHPGQHCDNQCTSYCNSQVIPDWYTTACPPTCPGDPTMQFNWSECYSMEPEQPLGGTTGGATGGINMNMMGGMRKSYGMPGSSPIGGYSRGGRVTRRGGRRKFANGGMMSSCPPGQTMRGGRCVSSSGGGMRGSMYGRGGRVSSRKGRRGPKHLRRK